MLWHVAGFQFCGYFNLSIKLFGIFVDDNKHEYIENKLLLFGPVALFRFC